MSYAKLHREIVQSSVWSEEKHTKIVWITLLALQDQDHMVYGSPRGLADIARVTLDEFLDAIRVLTSPDPYSQSRAEEGRRLVEVESDGRTSWRIVNGAYYRNLMSVDDLRERDARRKREARASADSPKMSKRVHVSPKSSDDVRDVRHLDPDPDPKPDQPDEVDPKDLSGRDTPIPLTFARDFPRAAITEMAAHYGVAERAITLALEEFQTYWSVGGGAGKARESWPRQFRRSVQSLHKAGKLADMGKAAPTDAEVEARREANARIIARQRAKLDAELPA